MIPYRGPNGQTEILILCCGLRFRYPGHHFECVDVIDGGPEDWYIELECADTVETIKVGTSRASGVSYPHWH